VTRRIPAIGFTVLLVALFTSGVTFADTPRRLGSAARCTTEAGSEVLLPPGVHLPEPVWLALDAEMRRLQDAETRLTAENASLKASLDKGGLLTTLKWLGAALLVGAAAGATAGYYF